MPCKHSNCYGKSDCVREEPEKHNADPTDDGRFFIEDYPACHSMSAKCHPPGRFEENLPEHAEVKAPKKKDCKQAA